MAKVIWVGTIEISYLDHEDSDKRKNAFTVVTTWASSAEEFRQKCELMLESYGWKLLDIDKASPAPDNYDYNEEVSDQLERTRSQSKCHYLWDVLHVPGDVNRNDCTGRYFCGVEV